MGIQLGLFDPTTGQTRYALTNSFGYYYFDNVTAGHTYLMQVYSKRYTLRFDSVVLNVTNDMFDENFVVSSAGS